MKTLKLPVIDKSWTLFLDRDGVINVEKYNDYILTWDEFRFLEGVAEAMKNFALTFGKIIVVTNQRGVGKGFHSVADVNGIHTNMKREITAAGGRIDRVYFESSLDNDHPNRKPQPGMGLQAMSDFPEIDFSKSLMVGNTLSDMHFGRILGVAQNILIHTREEVDINDPAIDHVFPTLAAFGEALAVS